MATARPASDVPARNSEMTHEVALSEEEIFDVSLATFFVFDKESTAILRRVLRLAAGSGCGCGCTGCAVGGCWSGTNYTGSMFGGEAGPPSRAVKPAHKYTQPLKRKHRPKSP